MNQRDVSRVVVRTASRLHFGLLSLPASCDDQSHCGDSESMPTRRFGGVGVMVARPGLTVRAEPSSQFTATGPLAERALAFARQFTALVQSRGFECGTSCDFQIEKAPPEHVGLGTGTQLGLAVGASLATLWRLSLSTREIAGAVGRGKRSSLGIHGFENGGLLVEAGLGRSGTIAPLVTHSRLPSAWRIVLARRSGEFGAHGGGERSAMSALNGSVRTTEVLCRLVLLGILPALAEEDVDGFGEALFEFNAAAGEPFAAIQGGTYSSTAVREFVNFARARRVRGVGQSSWGPTAFAIVGGDEQAHELAEAARRRFGDGWDIQVTEAAGPAVVETCNLPPGPPPTTETSL